MVNLIRKVSELYRWLDNQIENRKLVLSEANGSAIENCNACGNCCDFDSYGHRLYITPPELMYLAAMLDGWHGQNPEHSEGVAMSNTLRPMTGSRCPYQIDNKCSVHPYRFASCRIFFCRGNSEKQSELSEETLKRLKAICVEFHVPYSYTDLKNALNA